MSRSPFPRWWVIEYVVHTRNEGLSRSEAREEVQEHKAQAEGALGRKEKEGSTEPRDNPPVDGCEVTHIISQALQQ